MATAYIGEIKMVGWNFASQDWAMCNGQLISISQNPALFQVIGTAYGGDGVTNFALPDLRGRLPVHQGTGYALGQAAGSETVTLTSSQVPAHPHSFMCSTDGGTKGVPTQNVPANTGSGTAYLQATATAAMAAGSIPPSGGNGQPHPNLQPFQCVTFIICLYGIFPSQ
ncbi:MAG TPA: tail fiber protein [Streptosporangiaceae bacterium]